MPDSSPLRSTVWQAHQMCFAWPGRAAFENWSGRVSSGVTWVAGEESSGKTTLLRLMAGDLTPQSGQLGINGVPLEPTPSGYDGQVFWADPRSTVHDQISARAYFETLPEQFSRFNNEALSDLIEGLGLTGFLDRPLYMLSTGSRRKVWLAAGFASGAALTLLDEPFAALDKASIRFVLELLQDVADHGSRAWVVADYVPPGLVPLAGTIQL